MNKKTLIHTAFFAEAKPIIESLKLQCTQRKPCKVYQKDGIVLVVSGMGAKNTLHVKELFETYDIKKAVNIGIAGCKDTSMEIGSLVCTTHQRDGMYFESISSLDAPCSDKEKLSTVLVDMESETFLHVSKKFLDKSDIYIFKIVSDHLDTTIPKKEFVWNIIEKNLKKIIKEIYA